MDKEKIVNVCYTIILLAVVAFWLYIIIGVGLHGEALGLACRLYPFPYYYERYADPVLNNILQSGGGWIAFPLTILLVIIAGAVKMCYSKDETPVPLLISVIIAVGIPTLYIIVAGVFAPDLTNCYSIYGILPPTGGVTVANLTSITCPYSNTSLCKLWKLVTASITIPRNDPLSFPCYMKWKEKNSIIIYRLDLSCVKKLVEEKLEKIVKKYGISKPCLEISNTLDQYITCFLAIKECGVVNKCLSYAIQGVDRYCLCIKVLDR